MTRAQFVIIRSCWTAARGHRRCAEAELGEARLAEQHGLHGVAVAHLLLADEEVRLAEVYRTEASQLRMRYAGRSSLERAA